MALLGNHGIIIPRDKKLLTRLYWKEIKSLPEIAVMFGVNHKSILGVFRELDIPRRKVGHSRNSKCVVCGALVHKIKHSNNGSLYGKRCKKHWNQHRAKLAAEERKIPKVRQSRINQCRRSYYLGPINPTGEGQWISRSRVILRTARRVLSGQQPQSPAALQYQNAASELARILRR